MNLRLGIGIIIVALGIQVNAQGLEDTVLQLQTVEVKARQIFVKEYAGMKTTRVDTVLMMDKVNLSLSDLLAENTSVFIKDHGRGALASASFRGTAASHTQVNWNGMNINSPMAGMVDFTLIPVFLIDELNLKHGTASLADQNGGLGGSISIRNTVNWNNKFNLKYIQGIGSYHTFEEFLQLGVGNHTFQYKARLYHNYSRNDFTFINRGIGEIDPITGEIIHPVDTNKNADYKIYGLLQEFYVKPNSGNILSARWWWQNAQRTLPGATSYEGPNNSNLNKQKDNDHKIVLEWQKFMKHQRFMLRAGYSNKQMHYELQNLISGLGNLPVIYSKSREESALGALMYRYDLKGGPSFQSNLDFNHHQVNTRDTVSHTGYQQHRSEWSLLLAVSKSFFQRINLHFLLRKKLINNKNLPLVPYLGFDLCLIKNNTLFLKGNIARNFHYPTLNDLYWQPGGNPDLQPEQGISYELGLEYSIQLQNHDLQSEITAYRSHIDNWIIWIPSYKGYWEPRNIEQVLSKGLEVDVSLKGKLGRLGYTLTGNYAYTRSINQGNREVWGEESHGKQLAYVPLHSGNFRLHLLYRSVYITYQHHSYSERFTTSSNDITRRDWLYPYYMNDLVLGKTFMVQKISLKAEFRIYNLFNETYHSVLYRPMPGRNYMFLIMLKI